MMKVEIVSSVGREALKYNGRVLVYIPMTDEEVTLTKTEVNEPCWRISIFLFDDIAHEVWAASQLLPNEGVEDGVDRVVGILRGVR
jgi:hypothetical protein